MLTPSNDMWHVKPVPCDHIWAYYNHLWEQNHTLGWNLLRRGYRQWSAGFVESYNNLFGESLV